MTWSGAQTVTGTIDIVTGRDARADVVQTKSGGDAEPVGTEGVQDAPLPRAGRPLLPWVVAGASVVALGVGGLFYGAARSDADETRTALRRYRNATDATELAAARKKATSSDAATGRAETLAYAGLGVGAVLGGVATWLFLRGEDDGRQAWVVPGFLGSDGTRGTGAVVGTAF